jgi:hypothetical protein
MYRCQQKLEGVVSSSRTYLTEYMNRARLDLAGSRGSSGRQCFGKNGYAQTCDCLREEFREPSKLVKM